MTLSTERLILRPLRETDADAIFALRADESVNKYIDRPPTTCREDAVVFIEKIKKGTQNGASYYWAITLKSTGELIGTICLWNLSPDRNSAELGYELLPTMQGKGFMREALEKVMRVAKEEIGINILEAFTHKENQPSRRLLENAGFRTDPERKDPEYPNNIIFTTASAK